MKVYEDPHAWLRPHFATVRAENAAFPRLSPHHQFELLVGAVAQEQLGRAQEMRLWSDAAQGALLVHLAHTGEQGHTSDEIEMWIATKDARELRCIARHLPHGPIDLCVFHNGELRNSQLCPTGPDARTLANLWLAALEKSGWSQVTS